MVNPIFISNMYISGNKEFAEVCLQASGSINREGVIHFVKEVMKYPGMTVQDAAVLAAAKLVNHFIFMNKKCILEKNTA